MQFLFNVFESLPMRFFNDVYKNIAQTHCQVDGERPTLSLSSLFGRKFKKRRKKQHITVDDLEDPDSEDDDYKVCPTQIITTTQSPSFVRAQE